MNKQQHSNKGLNKMTNKTTRTINLKPTRSGYIRCLQVIAKCSTNKVDRVWAKRQFELIANEDKQEAK